MEAGDRLVEMESPVQEERSRAELPVNSHNYGHQIPRKPVEMP